MSVNIHIRGLDEQTMKTLRHRASEEGVSINKLILKLLKRSVGEDIKLERKRHHDLDQLAGTWGKTETKQFLKNISDFEEIDKEIWK